MTDVPIEVVMHFPEKTHRIRGYLLQLDLNNDAVPVESDWGRKTTFIRTGRTGFTLQGVIADWKDKDGRKQAAAAVDVVEARKSAAHAKRIARRERERTRRRAHAAS